MQCCAIKADGNRCTTNVIDNNVRCATHRNVVQRKGNNATRRLELKYVHEKNTRLIWHNNPLQGAVGDARELVIATRQRLFREEKVRYNIQINDLENIIAAELAQNGFVNPDIEILNRAMEVRRQRQLRIMQRIQAQREWHQRADANNPNNHPAILAAAARGWPVRDLAAIAQDRQNVHTEQVVAKIKKMVEIILKIPVPAEYVGLKTSGEIILECNLSKRSAWQMMAKYCQDEDIYNLGEGIYAKVLNSVWQYIKASPDAADLKKILASEMEDNVGMCAQGNLSRLCNILSGYIDGMNPDTKSRNEILGELLGPLMDLDLETRLARARAILDQHNVDADERLVWLEPLE
jgi:hypothetical protein